MADLSNLQQREEDVAVGLLRLARFICLDPEAALDWAERGQLRDSDPLVAAARDIAKAEILKAAGSDPQDPGQINTDRILAGAWRALMALAVEASIGTDRQPAEVIDQALDRIAWPRLPVQRSSPMRTEGVPSASEKVPGI